MQREQAATVGSRDRNLRLWKVIDGVSHKFVGGVHTDPAAIIRRNKGDVDDEEPIDIIPSDTDSEGEEQEGQPKEVPGGDGVNGNGETMAKRWDDKRRSKLMRHLRRQEIKINEGSLDVVAMLDEGTFITGGDSGAISLWLSRRAARSQYLHSTSRTGLKIIMASSIRAGSHPLLLCPSQIFLYLARGTVWFACGDLSEISGKALS